MAEATGLLVYPLWNQLVETRRNEIASSSLDNRKETRLTDIINVHVKICGDDWRLETMSSSWFHKQNIPSLRKKVEYLWEGLRSPGTQRHNNIVSLW